MTRIDADLIARAVASGDRAAFGALVRRHQSAVRGFLRHLTRGNHALADDLAQDAFIDAWRKLDSFRGDSSFLTWVLGIAHNRWRNASRRPRWEPLPEGYCDQASATPSPSRSAALRHDLAQALQQLSDEERTALHLGCQQGLSHSEIAAVLGWPLGTVKTHLARGKDRLRRLLSAWNPMT